MNSGIIFSDTYRRVRSNPTLCCVIMLCLTPLCTRANTAEAPELAMFNVMIDRQTWGDVSVLCTKTEYYINLPELLDILEYTYNLYPEKRSLHGSRAEEDSKYVIHGDTMIINEGALITRDIIWNSDQELFVNSYFLETRYDIKARFIFNSLTVELTPSKPVPAMLRMQREKKREQLLAMQEARKLIRVDTLPLRGFRMNALGYTFAPNYNSNQELNWQLRGAVNGEFLHGTILAQYDYTSDINRQNKNFIFNWNNPLLDKSWLKTFNVYRDYSNMQTTVNGLVTAVQLSNEGSNSFLDRSYTYQGKTSPNAEVEIYNNGSLIRYVMSDSLGNYRVQIPVYGGNNNIKAVTYDSYGTPLATETLLYLPPNLQAKHKLGYRLTTGYIDGGGVFISPTVAYGVTSFFTFSVGNETILSKDKHSSIAIIDADFAIGKRFRISLDYIPTVKWGAEFNAYIGKSLNGTISYEQYDASQQVIMSKPLKSFSLMLNGNLPFRKPRGNYFANVNYYKYYYGLSFGSYVGANIWWRKLYSTFMVSVSSPRLKIEKPVYQARIGYAFTNRWYDEVTGEYRQSNHELTVRNRLNYQTRNRLVCFAEVNYNVHSRKYIASAGVSWRLPWTYLKSGTSCSDGYTSSYLNMSGSMLFTERNVVLTDNFVGGSSLLVVPYVDVNGDKKYDKGEPIRKETKIIMRTSATMRTTNQGILFVNIPNNYAFRVLVPQQMFEDISWQIEPKDMQLYFSQYQSRTIYLPIRVFSEVSGDVYVVRNGRKNELSNLPLLITNLKTGTQIAIHTDDWGSYNYMGLTCGDYRIEASPDVLKTRQLVSVDPPVTVSIGASLEGVQLDKLNIELIPAGE